jgi:DNA polymerase-3 subunit delta'
MDFDEVIGQSALQSQLCEMVEHNRLSHALLFLGREGSGALPLAIAFAHYITCERVIGYRESAAPAAPSLFGEAEPAMPLAFPKAACGQCAACLKNRALVHPDVHFTFPVITLKSGNRPPLSSDYIEDWRHFIATYPYGNTFDWLQSIGAENKQGNITANECNDIIRRISLKSFEGGYKVLILWMPEFLDAEGNKLLKLIEEPPPRTLFILVAENENRILQTILSRTQLIKVPQPDRQAIREALIARAQVAPQTADQIAAVSDGNYREALQLVSHAGDDWQDLLREWLNAMLKSGPQALVPLIEQMAKLGREKQKQFLKYFTHLLETAIRVQILGEHHAWSKQLDPKELDFALRLNKIADVDQQQAITELLDQMAYYIERNANAKIQFHALSIRIQYIIRKRVLVNAW